MDFGNIEAKNNLNKYVFMLICRQLLPNDEIGSHHTANKLSKTRPKTTGLQIERDTLLRKQQSHSLFCWLNIFE